jgi:hypothetical protein
VRRRGEDTARTDHDVVPDHDLCSARIEQAATIDEDAVADDDPAVLPELSGPDDRIGPDADAGEAVGREPASPGYQVRPAHDVPQDVLRRVSPAHRDEAPACAWVTPVPARLPQ